MYAVWTVKHKPSTLQEIVGNKSAIALLKNWVKSWEDTIPAKRALFIYGPPGVGKTLSVEAVSKELNLEFIETNASDYRTEDAIKRFAGLASQFGSLFGGKRLVLLDELEGLTGNSDRGGIKAISAVIKNAKSPIVLISNNAYDTRFSALRNNCLLVQFKKCSTSDVHKHLSRICQIEGISAEDNALKFISHRSSGDVRSAVNDLQALSQDKKKLTYDDVSWLGLRNRQDTIFNVMRLAIYSRTCSVAKQAISLSDIDNDMLFEWIYENVPNHFSDPRDLNSALNALSQADIYRGRISSTQNWSYLRYVLDYMTAGVAMSRKYTKPSWVPFKFPSRIHYLSRLKNEKALKSKVGSKIKNKFHISTSKSLKEVLPFIRIIFQNNLTQSAKIAKWLDLDEEMIAYIAGTDKRAKEIHSVRVGDN